MVARCWSLLAWVLAAYVFVVVKTSVRCFVEKAMSNFQGAADSDFFKKVKASLALFASVPRNGAGGSDADVLRGEAAVKHHYEKVVQQTARGTNPTLGLLSWLIIFGWLLAEPQQASVTAWRGLVVASGAAAADASTKSGSDSVVYSASVSVRRARRL